MRSYLEFVVSLQSITPRIWRRFQITVNATFLDLHAAIQDSFGWEYSHLWEFHTPGRNREVLAGVPADSPMWADEDQPSDAEEVKLTGYFGAAERCVYWYDFGDDWRHTVRLRQRVSLQDRFYRRLLAGRRACPPEDCGGVSGYARLVSFLETGDDPWNDDVGEFAESVGDWKPDEFSLSDAKADFDR